MFKQLGYIVTIFLFLLSPASLAMAAEVTGLPPIPEIPIPELSILPELPPLPPAPIVPSCSDGLHNGNEEGVDCGGICKACIVPGPNPCLLSACPAHLQADAAVCEPVLLLASADASVESQVQLPEFSCSTPGDTCSCITCRPGTRWDIGLRKCVDDGLPPLPPIPDVPGDGTCQDGIQNGLEESVDCGGPDCRACQDDGQDEQCDVVDDRTTHDGRVRDSARTDRSGRTNDRGQVATADRSGDRTATTGRERLRNDRMRNGEKPTGSTCDYGFSLIDAKTDQPVRGFNPIQDGDRINLRELGLTDVTVQFNGDAGSVKMFANNKRTRTESFQPFSLTGDRNGDFKSWQPRPGQNTVSAVPFTFKYGLGKRQAKEQVSFFIEDGSARSMRVESFSLIDATTDKVIPEFDPLRDGDRINLAELPPELNIRANTRDAVGSVRLSANGQVQGIENIAPYSLGRDRDGDFQPWYPGEQELVLEATPFSRSNAQGERGQTSRVRVTFYEERGPMPPDILYEDGQTGITSFSLIDADTNREIPGFENIQGDRITLDRSAVGVERINVRANSGDGVASVQFYLNENPTRLENSAPWALMGDSEGRFSSWEPEAGAHEIRATPYAESRGRGEQGDDRTLTLNIR